MFFSISIINSGNIGLDHRANIASGTSKPNTYCQYISE